MIFPFIKSDSLGKSFHLPLPSFSSLYIGLEDLAPCTLNDFHRIPGEGGLLVIKY